MTVISEEDEENTARGGERERERKEIGKAKEEMEAE